MTEWEDERPLAPSALRILYLGKMLQDDETLESAFLRLSPVANKLNLITPLTELKFPTSTHPNPHPTIVHLSIRPVPAADEGLKKKKGRMSRTNTGNAFVAVQRINN